MRLIYEFMNKKYILLGLAFVMIVALAIIIAAPTQQDFNKKIEKKLTVVTTLFPLYDITRSIGGEEADVSLLLDPGMEAHSFEPTPSDMIKISQADVFIYTGKFMETWAEDVLKSVNNKNLLVIDASRNINLIEDDSEHHDEDGDEHHDEDGDEHHNEDGDGHYHHEGGDPHIWLDFDNLKTMVNNINDGLKEKSPKNWETFEFRAADYIDRISLIDSQYREGLTNCQQKFIIYSGHFAFNYLAKRYNLNYLSAYGLSPNSEPSAAVLIALAKQLKENNAAYIFHEELISPRIAETLERETGAKPLSLNAAHNLSRRDLDDGKTLFMVFEENLNNLKLGLNCR